MTRIALARYSELVRYDRAAGQLEIIGQQRRPELVAVTHADEQFPPLRALAALEPQAHAFALGYMLALIAREWRERPTDAGRGALIQMAQRLTQAAVWPAAPALIHATLQQADNALVEGQDAEAAAAAFVAEQVRLADRASDRCGRHAVNLVDQGDVVTTFGFGGPPLLSLLSALPQQHLPFTLVVAGEQAGVPLLVSLATAAGVTAHAAESTLAAGKEPPNVCIVVAQALARDGSAICTSGCGAFVEQARQQGIPCYLLAPSGPHAEAETAAQLVPPACPVDIVLPGLVSAIVTDRGTYRPAMIERYLGEGDAPPDVIPLL